jgi:hypothetical protein
MTLPKIKYLQTRIHNNTLAVKCKVRIKSFSTTAKRTALEFMQWIPRALPLGKQQLELPFKDTHPSE